MNLEEMSQVLKSSLGIQDNIVGVRLFKSEEEIPKDLDQIEKPFRYCSMIQTARLKGESFLARADYHECKGGSSGLGPISCHGITSNEVFSVSKILPSSRLTMAFSE